MTPFSKEWLTSKVVINPVTGCWVWTGEKVHNSKMGYGRVRIRAKGRSKVTTAHRFSYLVFNGPLTAEEQVRHSCDNGPCINPEHLLKGSQTDNARDAVLRGRNHTKLNSAQVTQIRSSALSNVALGKKFGVSDVLISQIRRGILWTLTA